MSWYRWEDDELHLFLHIQPRASRDEVTGIQGDRLKVRITAPPVEGQANAHLVKFLAKLLGVPRSRVRVASGEQGRQKHLVVTEPGKLPPPLDAASRSDLRMTGKG